MSVYQEIFNRFISIIKTKKFTYIPNKLKLGDGVLIENHVSLDPLLDGALITIGDNSSISQGCVILTHDACSKKTGLTLVSPVNIGKRVFIGINCIILPGVSIGDDSIVGAGSVVTKDIPAGVVVAGVPARIIKTADELHHETMQIASKSKYFDYPTFRKPNISKDDLDRIMESIDMYGYVMIK